MKYIVIMYDVGYYPGTSAATEVWCLGGARDYCDLCRLLLADTFATLNSFMEEDLSFQ